MPSNKNTDRKPSITTVEIARLAGVSQSTVSRVLNNNPKVDPDKRDAVLKVVKTLNFRPNLTAKSMVSGRSYAIGIVTRYVGSPFFTEVLRGIATELKGSPYSPIIALSGDPIEEDYAAFDLLLKRRPDALLLLAGWTIPDDYLRQLATETPLVAVGRQIEGLENHCITVNNFEAAYQATSYLIAQGHRHIAHISGLNNIPDAMARRQGYQQALIDHDIEPHPILIIESELTEAGGEQATTRLLTYRASHPFTAIFAANDQIAKGARVALYHHDLVVPADVSLVGFDDQPDSRYMIPPLTTIRQPAYEMGKIATQTILAMLEGKPLDLPTIPLELIVRESVANRG